MYRTCFDCLIKWTYGWHCHNWKMRDVLRLKCRQKFLHRHPSFFRLIIVAFMTMIQTDKSSLMIYHYFFSWLKIQCKVFLALESTLYKISYCPNIYDICRVTDTFSNKVFANSKWYRTYVLKHWVFSQATFLNILNECISLSLYIYMEKLMDQFDNQVKDKFYSSAHLLLPQIELHSLKLRSIT